jgi:hypothetical protein
MALWSINYATRGAAEMAAAILSEDSGLAWRVVLSGRGYGVELAGDLARNTAADGGR